MDKIAQALSDLSRRRFLNTIGTVAAGYLLPWPAWGADAVTDGDLRVIDESGEDYLYSADRFVPIVVPEAVQKSLLKAA